MLAKFENFSYCKVGMQKMLPEFETKLLKKIDFLL